jgi:[protein-PII] uridylyltransferase
MGFAGADVETLVRLVEHHLLLADVATRRDLDDPATVAAAAAAVGNRATLELLVALTEADSLATGPAAWGSWKAGLVHDLATRTARHLAGEPAPSAPAGALTAQQLALVDTGDLRVMVDPSRDGVSAVTVVAPDRRGLLASVSGTLALHGLDVRRAQVGGAGQMAIDVFEVEPRFGNPPDPARLAEDLEAALAGRLLLQARLEQRARDYRTARPLAARVAEVRVLVDNEASARATVIEIRAPDSPGLLHAAAQVLADLGVDVASARVATLGHEVVDSFYVVEAESGSKLSTERADAVGRTMRVAVENIS